MVKFKKMYNNNNNKIEMSAVQESGQVYCFIWGQMLSIYLYLFRLNK